MKDSSFDIFSFLAGALVVMAGVCLAELLRIIGVIDAQPFTGESLSQVSQNLGLSVVGFAGAILMALTRRHQKGKR